MTLYRLPHRSVCSPAIHDNYSRHRSQTRSREVHHTHTPHSHPASHQATLNSTPDTGTSPSPSPGTPTISTDKSSRHTVYKSHLQHEQLVPRNQSLDIRPLKNSKRLTHPRTLRLGKLLTASHQGSVLTLTGLRQHPLNTTPGAPLNDAGPASTPAPTF